MEKLFGVIASDQVYIILLLRLALRMVDGPRADSKCYVISVARSSDSERRT
jgi:hypothetical protein